MRSVEHDVTPLLPKLQAPTLVLHRREVPYPDADLARGLASQISGARLALLEGSSLLPYVGDTEPVLQAIEEFLGESEDAAAIPATEGPNAFRTVLFTDLVGHTEMMSRLGDVRGREVLREHERIVREALAEHSGTEVKTIGDGFMASFR